MDHICLEGEPKGSVLGFEREKEAAEYVVDKEFVISFRVLIGNNVVEHDDGSLSQRVFAALKDIFTSLHKEEEERH